MTRMLVLFGTTDGHTAKVAHAIAEASRACGFSVDVIRAGRTNPDPADYAAVVVAASVHASGYQRPVIAWLREHSHALRTRPSAFVSVCLGVLQPEPQVRQQLALIIDRLLRETSWQPTVTKLVAGALLYTQYGPIKRWVMKRIVSKAGGDTDTSRDYEYTDWPDLRTFAVGFAERVLAGERATSPHAVPAA